jgi:hypothetical protein
MSKLSMETVQARLDVMALALVTLARAVPEDRVAAVQEGLRRSVARRLDGVTLSPDADAAVAADLSRLMEALGDRPSRPSRRSALAG